MAEEDKEVFENQTSGSENIDSCKDEAHTDSDANQHLSKRLLRKMKKHNIWLERLPEKRAKEKQKKKQRRQEARERGETLGPSRKMLKLNSMEKSACKVKVVVDCSFDEYMGDKDIMKLAKQIGFCYSSNRRAENPLQMYVCGLHGQMKERFESIGDYKNWDVNFTEKDYFEEFDKDSIIYLTSDSPNILENLSDDHAYIIGGLVDHNHHKGLCYEMAERKGIAHAQLPIGQYVTLKSRKILTVYHVFEILLKYTQTKDWKASFFSTIPQRKVDTVESKAVLGNTNNGESEPINSVCNDCEGVDAEFFSAEGVLVTAGSTGNKTTEVSEAYLAVNSSENLQETQQATESS